jgi:hypothetical protein
VSEAKRQTPPARRQYRCPLAPAAINHLITFIFTHGTIINIKWTFCVFEFLSCFPTCDHQRHPKKPLFLPSSFLGSIPFRKVSLNDPIVWRHILFSVNDVRYVGLMLTVVNGQECLKKHSRRCVGPYFESFSLIANGVRPVCRAA